MQKKALVFGITLAMFTLLGAGCKNLPGTRSGEPMSPEISVNDQSLSGNNEIIIKEAAIDQNGWIVIHAVKDGQPADPIGYTSLATGKDKKIKITVDKNKVTPTLIAMLHYDRNPLGTYDFPNGDGPVIRDTKVIMDEFAISNYNDIKKEPTTETSQGNRKEFTITAKQWAFSPSSIKVKKGDMVVLKVTSADVAHGLMLPAFNVNTTINKGETKTIEFVADKAGTFTFSCNVPCGAGHKAMTGTLVVE